MSVTIQFEPEIKGWAITHAKRNAWRLPRDYAIDDLIQDAWLWFAECRKRYAHAENNRHFMRLFQRCFINHVHELASKRTRRREILDGTGGADIVGTAGAVRDATAEVGVLLDLATCPDMLRPILVQAGLISGFDGGKPLRKPRRRLDGTRETTNELLCQALGLNPRETNASALLREWISDISA